MTRVYVKQILKEQCKIGYNQMQIFFCGVFCRRSGKGETDEGGLVGGIGAGG